MEREESKGEVVSAVLKQSRMDLVLRAMGIADRIGRAEYKATALS